jgi:prepilin-type N-terminal cleavage/methylation domain-containing protein
MMKRQGFTLIEIIVSIFILTILFSIDISLRKLSNNLSYNMKGIGYTYEIQNLLSYGKAVCREKNRYGKITITASKNEFRFVEGWDNVEKIIDLPKGMKIISNDVSLMITPNGKITRGYTIKIIDEQGERHDIVITVGVD